MQLQHALRRAAGALAAVAPASRVFEGVAPASHHAVRSVPHCHYEWSRHYATPLPRPPAGRSGSMVGSGTVGRAPVVIPEDTHTAVPRFDARSIEDDRWVAPGCSGFEGGWSGVTGGGGVELCAAPKRKVTPHRKGRRNQFRRLKFVQFAQQCKDCGKVKQPHIYCDKCSTNIFDHKTRFNNTGEVKL